MQDACYYKCGNCNYEFLARIGNTTCPKCKSHKLEEKDMADIVSIDE